jgi:hypothetical protein
MNSILLSPEEFKGQSSPTLIEARGDEMAESANAKLAVGEFAQALTDQEREAAIQRASIAMRNTFIRWHLTGGFETKADYDSARNTWESMLMKWGQP